MSSERIRPAAEADLDAIGSIWFEDQVGDDPDAPAPPPCPTPSLYRYELASRELWVAERDGEVVAFAALLERDGIWFLADMFVRRAHQSSGLGSALLRALLPRDERPCCTVSSADPRALSLYVRGGMRPRWPHFQLLVTLADIRALPTDGIEAVQAQAGDAEMLRWDAEISGRRREADHRYWVRERGGVPLWFRRAGAVVGYGYAQTRSDDLPWTPDAISLGPLGVRGLEDAVGCVGAAVEWARGRASTVRIAVSGPHPALPALLEAGFRIPGHLETFCATMDEPFADPLRYVPSGGDLY